MANVYGNTPEEIAADQDLAHATALAKYQEELTEWRAKVDQWNNTPLHLRDLSNPPSDGPKKPRHPSPAKR